MKMTAAETTNPAESERVEGWRRERLERAGYTPVDAAEIASRTDIDLHRAVQLVEQGCPPELAAQILR